MSNAANRRKVSVRKVLSSRPFGRGFSDYRAGKALGPDAFHSISEQWAYERGRMFAAWYQGALRINRRLSHDAIVAASDALRHGALI